MENTENLKKTVFNEMHREMGAKMVPFAGFDMPVQFEGVNIEHETVRKGVGVFDVSHMGEFRAKGPKAFAFVQRCTTNDVAALTDGKVQYTCLPNGKGGIVDDLIVYHYSDEKYMLVVNAANIDKDWEWVNANNEEGVELENSSDRIAQLAVQGPKATEMLQKLTDVNLSEIKYYHFAEGKFAGVDNVIISNTGYTGAGGFELYFYPQYGQQIWDALFTTGAEYGIKPIGLGARDTLRLEKGFCLYGNDIDDTTSPIEAGLNWLTKFVENKPFIDRELMERQKKEGVTRKLVGFKLIDRGVPRHEYELADLEGNVIGHVTSGTMSPCLKVGVGMGYVKPELAKAGTQIAVVVRGRLLKAEVVRLPFV